MICDNVEMWELRSDSVHEAWVWAQLQPSTFPAVLMPMELDGYPGTGLPFLGVGQK